MNLPLRYQRKLIPPTIGVVGEVSLSKTTIYHLGYFCVPVKPGVFCSCGQKLRAALNHVFSLAGIKLAECSLIDVLLL